jgi:hypothetical protein
MPPLTDSLSHPHVELANSLLISSSSQPVLALHATDPPPISTTIRKTASEFKKVRILLPLSSLVLTYRIEQTHQVCSGIDELCRMSDIIFPIRTRGTATSWCLTKINYKTYQRCLLARRIVRLYLCRWPRAFDIDPRNKQMPELCLGRP